MHPTTPNNQPEGDRYIVLFLQVVGGISLLAFLAAVMPEHWMVETAKVLGIDPFPASPLTFYLARNLSLLYGFVGALSAADFLRFGSLSTAGLVRCGRHDSVRSSATGRRFNVGSARLVDARRIRFDLASVACCCIGCSAALEESHRSLRGVNSL